LSILHDCPASVAPASALPCTCPDPIDGTVDLCPACAADLNAWRAEQEGADIESGRHFLQSDEPCEDETPEFPIHCLYSGETSIETHFTEGRAWVDIRHGDDLIAAYHFATLPEARAFARSVFGEGGCDPDTLTSDEIAEQAATVSALAWAADNLDPTADLEAAEQEARAELGVPF
jgi:hypothetical protein